MKIVGIDINEVIREYKNRVIYYYYKDNNLDYENINYDDFKDKSLEEILDYKEETFEKFYIDNPIDVYYTTKDNITKFVDIYTKERQIDEFLYENYIYEIFGLAPKTYRNVGFDLNTLVSKNKDKYKFILLTKDMTRTVAPTMRFLSDIRLFIDEYINVKSDEELIERCDIYITANKKYKELFKNNNNKKLIMFGENNITNINDLIESKLLEDGE